MKNNSAKIVFHSGGQHPSDRGRQGDDLKLLSKQDIAELFQISERQVSKLMKKPEFPDRVKNLGRSVRFSASAVKEFVQNG
jgi:predicted DNA-binding transcriptional regulator AlpA